MSTLHDRIRAVVRGRWCWHLYGFWSDGYRMHGTTVIAQTKTCLKCGKERRRFRG